MNPSKCADLVTFSEGGGVVLPEGGAVCEPLPHHVGGGVYCILSVVIPEGGAVCEPLPHHVGGGV